MFWRPAVRVIVVFGPLADAAVAIPRIVGLLAAIAVTGYSLLKGIGGIM